MQQKFPPLGRIVLLPGDVIKENLVGLSNETFTDITWTDINGFTMAVPKGVYNLGYKIQINIRIGGAEVNEFAISYTSLFSNLTGDIVPDTDVSQFAYIEGNNFSPRITHNLYIPELVIPEDVVFQAKMLKIEDPDTAFTNVGISARGSGASLDGQPIDSTFLFAQKIRNV